MEQLHAPSNMVLYALTIAIVFLINYPGLWRPIFGRLTLVFCRRRPRPKRLGSSFHTTTQRVPSIGETADSSDPTTVDSLVETSEESEHRNSNNVHHGTIHNCDESHHETSSVLSKSSLSPDARKNVRFGSLSAVEEKHPEDAAANKNAAAATGDDPLRCSLHSTRSTATSNSRVSFSAKTEVIPLKPKPPVKATTTTTFNLDSIKSSRSSPVKRQDTNNPSMQLSLSSSEPASSCVVPWMVDHASVSSTKEDSMTGSEPKSSHHRIHTSSAGSSGGSKHSHLSSRLRSRLTQGPKLAKAKATGGDDKDVLIQTMLDTDSMPSSLSSDNMDRQSKATAASILS